uniref:Uncharacterized protein n=1 Tax=Timema tahoe TaxID=61484 RepID=A0A7R9IQ35_9NEOP|nr:unnamed protein product [Timema tahoe]
MASISGMDHSSQTAFQDQHINGPEFGDELFPSFEHDMPEGIEEMPMDLNEIFAWPETGLGGVQSPTGSPRRDSPSQPGSPSCGMGGTSDQHSPFPCNGTSRHVDKCFWTTLIPLKDGAVTCWETPVGLMRGNLEKTSLSPPVKDSAINFSVTDKPDKGQLGV